MIESTVTKGFQFSRWFITAVPAIVFAVFIIKALADNKPEVVTHAAYVHDGKDDGMAYTIPASYDVNASAHKKMSDYLTGSWFIALICFIIAVAGPNVYVTITENKARNFSFVPILVCWLIGIIGIVIAYSVMTESMHYSITLDEAKYQLFKDSLDNLFPKP